MKISLITDAPDHNLALMKLSTYHKARGDEVTLNMPLWKADYTYASWLFKNGMRFGAQEMGGPGVNPQVRLSRDVESLRPDYLLFNLRHSLGYTFRACLRRCPFCKVPLMRQDKVHHSIHEFHEPGFDTIELLNNNTFYDPLWEETFKEIHDAKLKVIEHGMDLRLLDEEKARWIKRLKWVTQPKFAWDRMRDEDRIVEGMKLLRKHDVRRATVYVLMGYDTTFEANLHRCEVIYSFGYEPWPMLHTPTELSRKFRRFIYLRYYKEYDTIGEAWNCYDRVSQNRRLSCTESNI